MEREEELGGVLLHLLDARNAINRAHSQIGLSDLPAALKAMQDAKESLDEAQELLEAIQKEGNQ